MIRGFEFFSRKRLLKLFRNLNLRPVEDWESVETRPLCCELFNDAVSRVSRIFGALLHHCERSSDAFFGTLSSKSKLDLISCVSIESTLCWLDLFFRNSLMLSKPRRPYALSQCGRTPLRLDRCWVSSASLRFKLQAVLLRKARVAQITVSCRITTPKTKCRSVDKLRGYYWRDHCLWITHSGLGSDELSAAYRVRNAHRRYAT